jgi:flavodoxin I
MKTVVVYDSLYGNTEKIAKAIADAITGEVGVLRAGEVSSSELKTVDLLIVGSPTHAGRPSRPMQELLKGIPAGALEGVKVAAFDTRLTRRWVGIFGYAAGRIAGSLKRDGAALIVSPEGFFVEGTEGPLREGEVERAAHWAQEIAKSTK